MGFFPMNFSEIYHFFPINSWKTFLSFLIEFFSFFPENIQKYMTLYLKIFNSHPLFHKLFSFTNDHFFRTFSFSCTNKLLCFTDFMNPAFFFFSRIYLSSPTNLSFLNILIFSPVFSWVHVCLKLFKLFFMNSTFFSLYHY